MLPTLDVVPIKYHTSTVKESLRSPCLAVTDMNIARAISLSQR